MRRLLAAIFRDIAKAGSKWWMVYDVIAALFALWMAFQFAPLIYNSFFLIKLSVFFGFLIITAGHISGLYDRNTLTKFWKLFFALIITTVLAIFLLTLCANIFLYHQIGRKILINLWLILVIICGFGRLLGFFLAKYFKIRVLVVGDHETAQRLAKRIKALNNNYLLVGFCDKNENVSGSLGSLKQIKEICSKAKINLIVVQHDYTKLPFVLDACFYPVKAGCCLMDEHNFFEQAFDIVLLNENTSGWFYAANLSVQNNIQAFLKRIIDISLASVGLFVISVFLPFIYIGIKLSSRGPIFYSQIRCGRFDKLFRIYKFRTMHINAEKDGIRWTQKNDDRITYIGKFLRKTRIDELPQLWNVLKGEMSIVGPRPERPELVKKIIAKEPLFSFRHWAKPGVTGFAQVRYRYGATIEDAQEKLKYDLYYIKNWSILLDLQIILRTLSTLMKGSR